MTYSVTIFSADGNSNTYACAGSNDQEALIYAGKVVEEKADPDDAQAKVLVSRNGENIGPASTVGDMTNKTV